MDFGELKDDKNFVESVTNFSNSLKQIDEEVTKCVEFRHYDKLSTEAKIKFDLYLSYTMNSLYWMYVKLQGADPNEHGIKNEISRVRQAMIRNKQVIENNTLRPTIDKEAAGRFIKHGIHYREDRTTETTNDENIKTEINKNIENPDTEEVKSIEVRDLENTENNKTQNLENINVNIEEIEDEEAGKFVKITKGKCIDGNGLIDKNENQTFNNTGSDNIIYSVSEDSENDKPTLKKVKKNNHKDNVIEITDDNESIKESNIRKKKKKKRKNMNIN